MDFQLRIWHKRDHDITNILDEIQLCCKLLKEVQRIQRNYKVKMFSWQLNFFNTMLKINK